MQMTCLNVKLTTRNALPTGAEGDTSIRPLAFSRADDAIPL